MEYHSIIWSYILIRYKGEHFNFRNLEMSYELKDV